MVNSPSDDLIALLLEQNICTWKSLTTGYGIDLPKEIPFYDTIKDNPEYTGYACGVRILDPDPRHIGYIVDADLAYFFKGEIVFQQKAMSNTDQSHMYSRIPEAMRSTVFALSEASWKHKGFELDQISIISLVKFGSNPLSTSVGPSYYNPVDTRREASWYYPSNEERQVRIGIIQQLDEKGYEFLKIQICAPFDSSLPSIELVFPYEPDQMPVTKLLENPAAYSSLVPILEDFGAYQIDLGSRIYKSNLYPSGVDIPKPMTLTEALHFAHDHNENFSGLNIPKIGHDKSSVGGIVAALFLGAVSAATYAAKRMYTG